MAQKKITKQLVREAYKNAQRRADAKFKQMVGVGDRYVVRSGSGKSYGLLGLCGFSWIQFSGVKEKNQLVKAGVDVNKSYQGGYFFDASRGISAPAWARKLNREADAYYFQSIDIKAEANKGFLETMQRAGFLKNAYVDTRLD